MTPDKLRAEFLSFFQKADHHSVASSPVVPEGDKTLLFTNAGMNQFKDVLLGLEKRSYTRATSAQKCIRAGGKHNDLDEVGKDGRHLTFFEMLGNWSFGDYYKKDAIKWAWKFVTEKLKLPTDRLFVSVYKDDEESYDFWHKIIGLPHSKIVRLGDIEIGDEENFWSMGPTGPCGPCSEIYYDHHPQAEPAVWQPGFDEDRFTEIWNLVFMAYNRDKNGKFTPLPIESVDTGMGLERVAAILSNVDNVFHTPVFQRILEHTYALLHKKNPDLASLYKQENFTSYCVIADHIRTVTFCISEGANFSNEGRGYVLRRILRRAVRHGRNLGFSTPFLHLVASAVVETFGQIYPELRLKQKEAAIVIEREEKRFFQTIERGITLFEEVADDLNAKNEQIIVGKDVFRLYDTYGFPPDLTEIMAQERSLLIDWKGYEIAMQQQKNRSKAADDRYSETLEWIILKEGAANLFIGYQQLEATVDVLRYRTNENDELFEICLSKTPFYAESGGQIGDIGSVTSKDGSLQLRIHNTKKTTAGITHFFSVEKGSLTKEVLSKPVLAKVDPQSRRLITCNHTATHLLHAGLHKMVSKNAYQAGSLVTPDKLRFDFNHDRPLTKEELLKIENWVNERIQENSPVIIHQNISLKNAENMGAMMIFGEKYGEFVRIVEVTGHSLELCGGIHVQQLSDIGRIRILSETGVAAGIRRIEAVSNHGVYLLAESDRTLLDNICEKVNISKPNLEDRIDKILDENAVLKKRINALADVYAFATATKLAQKATLINGVKVVAAQIEIENRQELLQVADKLRDQIGTQAIALLIASISSKPALLVLVTKATFKKHKIKAGTLVNKAALLVGGRGGGRPTLAQAGGKSLAGIPKALSTFMSEVRTALTK